MLGYVKLLVTITYYIFSADLKKKENLQYLKSLTRVYDQLSRDVRCWFIHSRELLCTYFSKRIVVYYRSQWRKVRIFTPNVISLKGPLCNLKQSHVLHRYFFENYSSPGAALLFVSLLYFRLTWTRPVKVSIQNHTLFQVWILFLFFTCPTSAISRFFLKENR